MVSAFWNWKAKGDGMTVQNTITKNIYIGNGSTTSFPFTFPCPKADYIKVFVRKNNLIAQTDNFTVDMDKATVTYPKSGTPLAAGENLVILRELPLEQPLNLVNQGPFFAEDIETTLDEEVMMIQQLREQLGRSLTVPVDIDAENAFETSVPIKPGMSFRVKDDGSGFEVTDDPAKVLPLASDALKKAEAARDVAVAKADAAGASAVSAAESEVAADRSATQAEAAKTAAMASETAAAQSAAAANASEEQAGLSAVAAGGKADEARKNADLAKGYADKAKASETKVATYANEAKTAASQAKTSATDAQRAASQADTSAVQAGHAMSTATTKAEEANVSAANAKKSEELAKKYSDMAYDVVADANAIPYPTIDIIVGGGSVPDPSSDADNFVMSVVDNKGTLEVTKGNNKTTKISFVKTVNNISPTEGNVNVNGGGGGGLNADIITNTELDAMFN